MSERNDQYLGPNTGMVSHSCPVGYESHGRAEPKKTRAWYYRVIALILVNIVPS